jgi:hypothetical protein
MDFDTGIKDDALKHDFLWGFNVGWILPVYKKAPNEFYYF